MHDGDILILKGDEIFSALKNRESDLIAAVRQAYEIHADGNSSLPHSTFLRFPDDQANRIIALPGYIGNDLDIAGIKWISSFPGNLRSGKDRASAVIVLNSTETGRPTVILEGSIISAKRTAASAALAALTLQDGMRSKSLGIIGCGLINFETVRFLLATLKEIESILLFDKAPDQARMFQSKCRDLSDQIDVQVVKDVNSVIQHARLISFATTAIQPHIFDTSAFLPGSVILHLSLRDMSPEVILSSDNVIDDIDHICRAQTSIHLAEQLSGNRDFIRCTLAETLRGVAPAKSNARNVTIFSPFGLGILDLALSKFVVELALQRGDGTIVSSFLPGRWVDRA